MMIKSLTMLCTFISLHNIVIVYDPRLLSNTFLRRPNKSGCQIQSVNVSDMQAIEVQNVQVNALLNFAANFDQSM